MHFTLPQFDISRIRPLLNDFSLDASLPAHLSGLVSRFENSAAVPPQSVPDDIVTMNSTFRLYDPYRQRSILFSLVFPMDANRPGQRLSILSPLGAAVYGTRENTSFTVKMPFGTRRYIVTEIIFQPESAGRYDL